MAWRARILNRLINSGRHGWSRYGADATCELVGPASRPHVVLAAAAAGLLGLHIWSTDTARCDAKALSYEPAKNNQPGHCLQEFRDWLAAHGADVAAIDIKPSAQVCRLVYLSNQCQLYRTKKTDWDTCRMQTAIITGF